MRCYPRGPRRAGFALLALSLLLSPGEIFAFRIEEHSLITARALEDAGRCLGAPLPADLGRRLLRANRWEDLNLLRKWSRHSHYFHPGGPLPQRRYDSSVRLLALELRLEALLLAEAPDQEEIADTLGHILHHIQDVASPPHVVPVYHGLSDGFEGFDARAAFAALPPVDCAALRPAPGPTALLRETALETLGSLEEDLSLLRDAAPATAPWASFWRAAGAERGGYGPFGNRFGEERFRAAGVFYEIPRAAYEEYKAARMSLAALASARLIASAFSRLKSE